MCDQIESWFRRINRVPHAFQHETWAAARAGGSGLIQVPTGSGKTYAAYGAALDRLVDPKPRGLRVLYITPLRAMTRDLEAALKAPVEDLELPASVESRTGDTSSSVRNRQRRRLPEVLLTTPESLTLLLTYANATDLFVHLETVIVDEWHELLAGKRGTQVELALACMRRWRPNLQTWGLSATLANPQTALRHLAPQVERARVVTADIVRPLELRSLYPRDIRSVPWAGNMGLKLIDTLLAELDPTHPTIVFTNTRNQAEAWHQRIAEARPDWSAMLGLHHGSLDREGREHLESGLKTGEIRIVIATSSLDLGVDFSPIERIVQIGSPKGVARLMQRAGRSNHRLGETGRLLCLPANALHLLEFAAAREAIERGEIEAIEPPREPVDVLCQQLVNRALCGGFDADALFAEITSTAAYANLSRERFDWALDLVARGGKTLSAYPDYRKLTRDGTGRWTVAADKLAKRHRMAVGTITSDSMVQVRFTRGARIGQVEESFAGRLKRGETFLFGGRVLAVDRFRDMTLFVRKAVGARPAVPRWLGGRMPLSTELSRAMRRTFDAVARDDPSVNSGSELTALRPVLDIQRKLSAVPRADEVLVERLRSREGDHCFCFTFEGRLVNDGLGALIAYRMAKLQPATFTVTVNDYGIEWLCPENYPFDELLTRDSALFRDEDLLADTLASINVAELAKRQFRGIARVAGLTFDGYPGSRKSGKQQQISSGLIYDVFVKFDPGNLLLQQARQEVLETQFEQTRLRATLGRLRQSKIRIHHTERPTPFALPLLADRLVNRLSTEKLEDRIERIKKRMLDTSGSVAQPR